MRRRIAYMGHAEMPQRVSGVTAAFFVDEPGDVPASIGQPGRPVPDKPSMISRLTAIRSSIDSRPITTSLVN